MQSFQYNQPCQRAGALICVTLLLLASCAYGHAPAAAQVAGKSSTPLADLPGTITPSLTVPIGQPMPVQSNFKRDASATSKVSEGYGSLPLSFEVNKGQVSSKVAFISRGKGCSLFLTPTEAVFAITHACGAPAARQPRAKSPAGSQSPASFASMLHMRLIGANPAKMSGMEPLPGTVNYLTGQDPKQWHTDIQTYRKVLCKSVYPGVDLIYYGSQQQLEYDFVVAPGADPSRIELKFEGAKGLRVSKSGDLDVGLSAGSVRWRRPTLYQTVDGKRRYVSGGFVRKGVNRAAFVIAKYDRHRPLIIDPVFAYSTYLGGSSWDDVYGAAVDSDGYVYVTGKTNSSDFPGTSNENPFLNPWFVTKLDPTGTRLIYTTYAGSVQPTAIAVDKNGQTYVVGSTGSSSLPIVRGAQTTLPSLSHSTAFLMEINSAGNNIVYSTYLGGSNAIFQAANCVALGPDGTVYIGGSTDATDFPIVSAYQSVKPSAAHVSGGFLTRIDTTRSGLASLIYSSYLGGTDGSLSQDDGITGIAVDSAGHIFTTGNTLSTTFPVVSAYEPSKRPANLQFEYAFVTEFAADGSRLLYSTYLGGTQGALSHGIAIDSAQHAFITGETASTDLPVRNAIQTAFVGESDGFAAEFDCAASGDASLVYSTYLSGERTCRPWAVAADLWGNAYITGEVSKHNAVGPTPATNAFLVKLAPGSGRLMYVSGIGDQAFCRATSIAVDPLGCAYIAGIVYSQNFPVTPGAFQTQGVPGNVPPGDIAPIEDVFISKIPTYSGPDINGDQFSDLIFQSASSGQLKAWLMRGDGRVGTTGFVPSSPGANWILAASADMNGDGYTDLLFQNTVTGDLAYWLMIGTTAFRIDNITPKNAGTNWRVAGMADFNRDGYPDILFQNTVTGAITVWYMHGGMRVYGAGLAAGYTGKDLKVVAVGDLNNDGQADVVLQDTVTGQVQVLWMYRGTVTSSALLSPAYPGAGWNVVGLADINADGRTELLFQNATSGDLAYWALIGNVVTYFGQGTASKIAQSDCTSPGIARQRSQNGPASC